MNEQKEEVESRKKVEIDRCIADRTDPVVRSGFRPSTFRPVRQIVLLELQCPVDLVALCNFTVPSDGS